MDINFALYIYLARYIQSVYYVMYTFAPPGGCSFLFFFLTQFFELRYYE
jgi:hypothetical protein